MKKSLALATGAVVAVFSLAACGSDEPEKSAEDVAADYCAELTKVSQSQAASSDDLLAAFKKVEKAAPEKLQDNWKKVNDALKVASDYQAKLIKDAGLPADILESANVSEADQAKLADITAKATATTDPKVKAAQESATTAITDISAYNEKECDAPGAGNAPAPAPAPSASTPAQ